MSRGHGDNFADVKRDLVFWKRVIRLERTSCSQDDEEESIANHDRYFKAHDGKLRRWSAALVLVER